VAAVSVYIAAALLCGLAAWLAIANFRDED
jgi:hypothetical protein